MKPFFQKVINESLESEFLIDKHNGYPEKRLPDSLFSLT